MIFDLDKARKQIQALDALTKDWMCLSVQMPYHTYVFKEDIHILDEGSACNKQWREKTENKA